MLESVESGLPDELLAHPRVAENIEALRADPGSWQQQMKLTLRIMEVAEERYGPSDPVVAASLHWQGALYQRVGDRSRQKAAWERCLKLKERHLAVDQVAFNLFGVL